MYRETNSRKTGGILIIIAFVVLVAVLNIVLGMIPVLPVLKDVAFIAVMVAFVLLLIKRYLCAYEYELGENHLTITTYLGGRERACAEIEYTAIECFCHADDEKLKLYDARARMFYAESHNKYAIVFDAAEGKTKIIFAPSEHMVSLIENKIHSASKEE